MSEHRDAYPWDDECQEYEYKPRTPPTCKRCGDSRVIWLIHKNKWKLHHNETGELHICKSTAAADFGHLKKEQRS